MPENLSNLIIKDIYKKKKKKHIISAKIPQHLFDEFSKICKKENIFRNDVINILIEDFVNKYENRIEKF